MSVERTGTCVPSIAPTHIGTRASTVQNHARYPRVLPVSGRYMYRGETASNADNTSLTHALTVGWEIPHCRSMLCCWLPSWRRTSTTRSFTFAGVQCCALPVLLGSLRRNGLSVSSVYRNVVYFIPQFICHLASLPRHAYI